MPYHIKFLRFTDHRYRYWIKLRSISNLVLLLMMTTHCKGSMNEDTSPAAVIMNIPQISLIGKNKIIPVKFTVNDSN